MTGECLTLEGSSDNPSPESSLEDKTRVAFLSKHKVGIKYAAFMQLLFIYLFTHPLCQPGSFPASESSAPIGLCSLVLARRAGNPQTQTSRCERQPKPIPRVQSSHIRSPPNFCDNNTTTTADDHCCEHSTPLRRRQASLDDR